MNSTLKLVVFANLALMLLLSNVAEACLANNEGCEPDGSKGVCCSGYCYKQKDWSIGVCANRKKRAVCLAQGLPCKYDGSRGNCCSNMCNQLSGQEWGNCS